MRLNEQLQQIAEDDARVKAELSAAFAQDMGLGAGNGHAAPETELGPMMTCLQDVEPREVSWLWPGRIPLGRITLLVGRPGEGKSYLTAYMAARVSRGRCWPDGSACDCGSVLLMTGEDDPADTIRPRLDAHNADCRRVHLLSAVRRVDGEGQYERLIRLDDVDAIGQALERLGDCRLVVVDPVGSFLGGRTDAHRDNEVRAVLAPLAALAEQHGPAVLLIAHRRKASGAMADDLALGSRAFTGIARAVWHLSRDPDDKTRRLLLPGKCNLAPEGHGLAFSIVGKPASLRWEEAPVKLHADDAVAAEQRAQRPGPAADDRREAEEFLRQTLADGPRQSKDVEAEARGGHGISAATLRRARKAAGVVAYQPTKPGPWWLRLPDAQPRCSLPTKDREPEHLEHLDENTGKTDGSMGPESQALRLQECEHLGDGNGQGDGADWGDV